jgi:hypothetical protein
MMKQLILTLMVLLTMVQQNSAQQTAADKLALFRTDVLPQYNTYFSNADLNENGQLLLMALNAYKSLALNSKKVILDNLVKRWQESLVIIQYDSKSELWGTNVETGRAIRIDSWDVNATNVMTPGPVALSGTGKHPFFVYGGGSAIYNSNHVLNASLNGRVGFFLLKNKWDLAWCFSGGVTGNTDESESSSDLLSVGLMSKFYFPIPKLKISPSVGIDLESTVYTDTEGSSTDAVTRSLLLGISWYVGPGSFDVGYRINKASSLTVGYTFMPGANRKKKK